MPSTRAMLTGIALGLVAIWLANNVSAVGSIVGPR